MKTLFNTLLNSTADYVYNRIQNQVNREHYLDEVGRILILTRHHVSLKTTLLLLQEEYEVLVQQKQFKLSFFSDPKKYRKLAYEHAMDAAECLYRRFGDSEELV